MTDNNNTPEKRMTGLSIALAVLVLSLGVWIALFMPSLSPAQVYNETSLVNTTVNITNSAPLVFAISIDDPIDLIAYGNKTVYCNISVFDYDNDTLSVNATLYLDGVSTPDAADDGNNHYTNTSCTATSPQDRDMNFTCAFDVKYYADNSTNWMCNATVIDDGNAFSSNLSEYTTINPLIAIKIPELLDYGDLAVNEISEETWANITNAGNRDANISVEGYGNTPGDGFAFICDYGQIDLNYERYNLTGAAAFGDMTPLTSATTLLPDFYVPQRVSETEDSINATKWRVQIPVGAGGVCNGKILFTASDRGN